MISPSLAFPTTVDVNADINGNTGKGFVSMFPSPGRD